MFTKEELMNLYTAIISEPQYKEMLPEVPKPTGGFFTKTFTKAQIAQLTLDVNDAYNKIRKDIVERLTSAITENGSPTEWPASSETDALNIKAGETEYKFDLFGGDYYIGNDNKVHAGEYGKVRFVGGEAEYYNEILPEMETRAVAMKEELDAIEAPIPELEEGVTFAKKALEKEETVLFAVKKKEFGFFKKSLTYIFIITAVATALYTVITRPQVNPGLFKQLSNYFSNIFAFISKFKTDNGNPVLFYGSYVLMFLALILIGIPGFVGYVAGYFIGAIKAPGNYLGVLVFAFILIAIVFFLLITNKKVVAQKNVIKESKEALKAAERKLSDTLKELTPVLNAKKEAYEQFLNNDLKTAKDTDDAIRQNEQTIRRSWQTAWVLGVRSRTPGDAQR